MANVLDQLPSKRNLATRQLLLMQALEEAGLGDLALGQQGLVEPPSFFNVPEFVKTLQGEREFFPGRQLGRITFMPGRIGPSREQQAQAAAIGALNNIMERRALNRRLAEQRRGNAVPTTGGGLFG